MAGPRSKQPVVVTADQPVEEQQAENEDQMVEIKDDSSNSDPEVGRSSYGALEEIERMRRLLEDEVLKVLNNHEDRIQDLERAGSQGFELFLQGEHQAPATTPDPHLDVPDYTPQEQAKGETPWYHA